MLGESLDLLFLHIHLVSELTLGYFLLFPLTLLAPVFLTRRSIITAPKVAILAGQLLITEVAEYAVESLRIRAGIASSVDDSVAAFTQQVGTLDETILQGAHAGASFFQFTAYFARVT